MMLSKRLLRCLLLVCILMLSPAISAQYQEDFSVDLSNWHGTDSLFRISSGRLQLYNPEASGSSLSAYLSTVSRCAYGSWECDIDVQTTLTTANNVRYYLLSSNANLNDTLKGYYVLVGGTDKAVSLYRQSGKTTTKIIAGTANRLNSSTSNICTVKVVRTSANMWLLYSKLPDESDFVLEGTTTDKNHKTSAYSGIFVRYSSSNKDKYFFDNIICEDSVAVELPHGKALWNDVVINEIMAKPAPAVGLPEIEYVELYNRSDSTFDLSGWTFVCKTNVMRIAQGEIKPHEYALLCANSSVSNLSSYGNVIGLSSFTPFVNAGAIMSLYNEVGELINAAEYSEAWYEGDETFKRNGGWSLEKIDVDNLNISMNNWLPSVDVSGGTPGRVNSVAASNRDGVQPVVEAFMLTDKGSLAIRFNKTMDIASLSVVTNYDVANNHVVSVVPSVPLLNEVVLSLSDSVVVGETIELSLSGLHCVSGYTLTDTILYIRIPTVAYPKCIVLNELMYQPRTNESEWIELWNVADESFLLSSLFVSTRNKSGELGKRVQLSNNDIVVNPNSYVLVGADCSEICNNYNCGAEAVKCNVKLPALSDEGTCVVLTNVSGEIIDEVCYSPSWHNELIKDVHGVSLERVSADVESNSATSWHSAAASVGYATPGYQNSQQVVDNLEGGGKSFELEYKDFSPNNDGFRDVLVIKYSFKQSDYLLTANVFTPDGVIVRRLANNELLSIQGTITWDGTNDKGVLAPIGVYVVVLEAFRLSGDKQRAKLVCTMGM